VRTDLEVVEGDLACSQLCPRTVIRRLPVWQLDDCFTARHVALTNERHRDDRRAKQRLDTDRQQTTWHVLLNQYPYSALDRYSHPPSSLLIGHCTITKIYDNDFGRDPRLWRQGPLRILIGSDHPGQLESTQESAHPCNTLPFLLTYCTVMLAWHFHTASELVSLLHFHFLAQSIGTRLSTNPNANPTTLTPTFKT